MWNVNEGSGASRHPDILAGANPDLSDDCFLLPEEFERQRFVAPRRRREANHVGEHDCDELSAAYGYADGLPHGELRPLRLR